MVGLFGLIGAYYNLTQIDSTLALVSQVVTGSGAIGVAQWQQIESPWLVTLCFSVIPSAKILSGLLCLFCVKQMWSSKNSDTSTFQQSKQVGMAGCGVMLAMLFGVFILASETWFQQWQTELGAAILGPAERYIISVGVIAFFINLADDLRA
jgi:predicted small integral membrane protein